MPTRLNFNWTPCCRLRTGTAIEKSTCTGVGNWRRLKSCTRWANAPFTTTRSNFGYRVLNSPDLGAVDVDFDLGPGIVETHIAAQQKEALSNIRDWVAAHPEQCWRVYRTAGGLRMIRTDAPQPLDETYVAVGKAIEQSDRLYCNLRVPICESFRLMPPSWFLRFWTDQAYLG